MASEKEEFPEEEIPVRVSNPQQPKLWRRGETSGGLSLLAQVTTLAWNLVLPIVGGVILGHFIDTRTQTHNTWTLSLLVLGIMVAFSNLYNIYMEHGRQKKTQEKEQSENSDKENHEEQQ